MGGTYAEYQTIIQKYKVRLQPDTHRRRERQETGEILSDPRAWRAYANPTLNGKTVMIGDRFYDEKNNQCYDVVAVQKPRGKLAHSAFIQYDLRIIEDCPGEAVGYPVVPIATVSPPGSAANPIQQHFIMRHFGYNEIFDWEALPYFDGFTYDLQYDDPLHLAELAAIVAAGKSYFRYYNIQQYPYSATEFGGLAPPLATWFNWIRDNLQFLSTASHRRMRVATQVALFPGSDSPMGQERELIPWGVVSTVERQAAVAQMIALANSPGGIGLPCRGVFLDQAWLTVESFQVDSDLFAESGHGDTQESGPPLTALSYGDAETAFGDGGPWTTHQASMMALYEEFATGLESISEYAIKNGEHREQNGQTIPKPWYFENAWNSNLDGPDQPTRWANAKAEFATDQRNVLSIICTAAENDTVGVPEALDHWAQVGGWIAFTTQAPAGVPNAELAYSEAAARLATIGWPR
jgi:hypothetical protein